LTHVQFNREGDLLFSCSKDNKPTAWFADNGERWGTYNGHNGCVWHLDVNLESTLLLTAGADQTCRLWEVNTGTQVGQWDLKSAVRCVGFAEGDGMFLSVGDKAMKQDAAVFFYRLDKEDPQKQDNANPIGVLKGHSEKICRAAWGNLNETIASASDDGTVRLWDLETQQEICRNDDHTQGLNNLKFSEDRTMMITSSKDRTSRLLDARTLECLKVYTTKQPVNDAVISPLKPHVIVGGGQEARTVARTGGKFDAHFHHLFQEEWLGDIKGHFGPINALAVAFDGKTYASGSEDGNIRIHHLDDDYLAWRD
jgi:translation initiation factor 3 subunit I